jgi:hypothetical protein
MEMAPWWRPASQGPEQPAGRNRRFLQVIEQPAGFPEQPAGLSEQPAGEQPAVIIRNQTLYKESHMPEMSKFPSSKQLTRKQKAARYAGFKKLVEVTRLEPRDFYTLNLHEARVVFFCAGDVIIAALEDKNEKKWSAAWAALYGSVHRLNDIGCPFSLNFTRVFDALSDPRALLDLLRLGILIQKEMAKAVLRGEKETLYPGGRPESKKAG